MRRRNYQMKEKQDQSNEKVINNMNTISKEIIYIMDKLKDTNKNDTKKMYNDIDKNQNNQVYTIKQKKTR